MWLAIASIVLISFSMRAPMGTVGPLVPEIRQSLGISASTAGFLTTLPLLLFALCAPIAGRLISKVSFSILLPSYLCLVAIGVVLRSNLGVFGLFTGTALIGVGTGCLNATMPAFIRSCFSKRIGSMMGLYSTAMTFSSAMIAVLVQMMALWMGGWRPAMMSVVSVCILAIAFSCVYFGYGCSFEEDVERKDSIGLKFKLFSFKNVCIALYMGLQSLVFYSMLTWYPTIATSLYELPFKSGLLITIMQVISLVPTFLVPVLSQKANLKVMSSFLALLFIPGILLAGFGGSYTLLLLGTIVCGFSLGGSFSMAITFCAVNGRTAKDTAALTSFGQLIGYILAAAGPVGIGLSFDLFGSWSFSIVLMAVLSVAMGLAGIIAGGKS